MTFGVHQKDAAEEMREYLLGSLALPADQLICRLRQNKHFVQILQKNITKDSPLNVSITY
jgi:hypothetical protein